MPCTNLRREWHGQFVVSTDNKLGVAKVIDLTATRATVRYFDSVGALGQVTVVVPRQSVKRVILTNGTRGYWQIGGQWRAGIVTGHFVDGYRLRRFEIDHTVPESELFVRWSRPIADPTELLVARVFEQPRWYASRARFSSAAVRQRTSCEGISSLLSSVVDLHLHQVDVVRRVLEDPIQRYLLADEVGLGKTIEAGYIIREHLHEDPNGRVLIVVPAVLVQQWTDELEDKFLLSDLAPQVRWWLLDHESLVAKAEWLKANTWTLLVVDEAHRLTRPDLFDGATFTTLRDLATSIPRLLLLSATPLLNNEASFFGMLHLLDPAVHDLKLVEDFRVKVQNRQEVARLFYTFDEHQPPFLISEKLDILVRLFPNDDQLSKLTKSLAPLLEMGESELSSAAQALVREIRVHVGEQYRLHRRLLRHRRSKIDSPADASGGQLRPSRAVTDLIQLGEPAGAISTWLELVRDALVSSELNPERASVAFAGLAESSVDPDRLRRLTAKIGVSRTGANRDQSADDSSEFLRDWRASSEDLKLVGEGPAIATKLWRHLVETLASKLSDAITKHKVVVFVTDSAAAARLFAELELLFGRGSTLLVGGDESDRGKVAAFRADPRVRILVSDRRAEEGLNLQNADIVVHFDLPFAPIRIEQRMGRLDRLGRSGQVRVWLFGYPKGSLNAAWKECLDEFGVLDHSIASFQYAIQELMPSIIGIALSDGPEGLSTEARHRIKMTLQTEGQAIEEQDALDALEVESASVDLLRRLEQIDRERNPDSAFDTWVSDGQGILQFTRKINPRNPDLVRYEFGQRSRLPEIPVDELVRRYRKLTERWGSFRRAAARAHSGTRLFRLGEPFFDAILDFTSADDRGSCTAVWRRVQNYEELDWLAIGFNYVVETDLAPVAETIQRLNAPNTKRLSLTNLRHRADRLFPPKSFPVWLDLSLNYLDTKGRDAIKGLGTSPTDSLISPDNRTAIGRVIPPAQWEDFVRGARRESEAFLRRTRQFSESLAKGIESARAAREFEEFQSRSRLKHDDLATEESKPTTDALWESMLEGVSSPRLAPDSVAVAIISADPLPGERL